MVVGSAKVRLLRNTGFECDPILLFFARSVCSATGTALQDLNENKIVLKHIYIDYLPQINFQKKVSNIFKVCPSVCHVSSPIAGKRVRAPMSA